MGLNAVDILILAVLALAMLFGLLRGFVSSVLSLLCWVAAFWVAWAFGDRVAAIYALWLQQPTACIIAGYVTCFLGVLLAAALLGWAVRRLLDRGGLRADDRLLGMVFGLAQGLLAVTFVVLMLGFTALPQKAAWWRQSALLPGFERGATWVAQALPPEVTHYLSIGGKSLPALTSVPISALQQAGSRLGPPAAAVSAGPAASASSGRAPGHGPARRDVGQ